MTKREQADLVTKNLTEDIVDVVSLSVLVVQFLQELFPLAVEDRLPIVCECSRAIVRTLRYLNVVQNSVILFSQTRMVSDRLNKQE